MADELAYAMITPYNLIKSRTGGIIARLLARTEKLDLVGARMYAPSDAMIDEYKATIDEKEAETPVTQPRDPRINFCAFELVIQVGEDGSRGGFLCKSVDVNLDDVPSKLYPSLYPVDELPVDEFGCLRFIVRAQIVPEVVYGVVGEQA